MSTPSTSTRVPPAPLSDVMEWSPELIIIAISLAFAGAFSWPLLGIPALLATSRIIGGRYLQERRNQRAIREYEAAQHKRATARELPAVGEGES